jgi:hypothetical protein
MKYPNVFTKEYLSIKYTIIVLQDNFLLLEYLEFISQKFGFTYFATTIENSVDNIFKTNKHMLVLSLKNDIKTIEVRRLIDMVLLKKPFTIYNDEQIIRLFKLKKILLYD